MFTSAGFGIAGKPGSEAAAPNVGSGKLLNGFCMSGNKSAPKGTASNTSLILSIISDAPSKGLVNPKFCALISNISLTSLEIVNGLN